MNTESIIIQKTVFDLDTFNEVTLVKASEFTPAADTTEVLARIGNDAVKMLALLNEGLKEETRRNLRAEVSGWHTYEKDAEGEDTEKVNGEFAGTVADMGSVNALRLNLAKTVFGLKKNMSVEEKRKAKESAMELIKNTPAIKAGLQASAAKDSAATA